jgi:hypothetical protein
MELEQRLKRSGKHGRTRTLASVHNPYFLDAEDNIRIDGAHVIPITGNAVNATVRIRFGTYDVVMSQEEAVEYGHRIMQLGQSYIDREDVE